MTIVVYGLVRVSRTCVGSGTRHNDGRAADGADSTCAADAEGIAWAEMQVLPALGKGCWGGQQCKKRDHCGVQSTQTGGGEV